MTTYQWVSCNANTGVVIMDLPGLSVPDVEDVMMGYSTTSGDLMLTNTTPTEWVNATRPGAAYLVLLEDDVPVWGGLIGRRERTEESNKVTLALATIPSYLRRRFVGDVTFTDEDQCAIVEAVVAAYGETGGLPFDYDVSASATTRDRTYRDIDDKTVYSVLSELAGVEGGPEWMVGWIACDVDGKRAFCPELIVRDRLGSTPNAGMDPAVTWGFPPGAVASFRFVEDYTDGQGANDVLAVSTAINNERPESAHATITDDDRPTHEARFTPSTSITEVATLDAHAARKLGQVGAGTITLALDLNAEASRFGTDVSMGDTVGFRLMGTTDAPLLNFPGGLTGTARVVGHKRTLTGVPTITPYLADLEITDGWL